MECSRPNPVRFLLLLSVDGILQERGPWALYKWDKRPKLITFSTLGVLYNYVEPIGLIMRETLGRAHNWRHRLPAPDFFEKNFFESYREW